MPAAVETAVYANTPAWHREGTVLDTEGELGMTVQVALEESGLDWDVVKVPIYAPVLGTTDIGAGSVEIKGRYGVQRLSDGEVLGVVGKTWQPVQNRAGFDVIEEFMQGDRAHIEAAGSLLGGRKVWILAHMAEDLQIAGETICQYVLFVNGHDGRTSVTAAMTDVRAVCDNTVTWAIEDAPRIVRVRHTTKATERLSEAKRILGLRDKRAEELAKQGEWLVNKEMSDRQFDNFLAKLMPIPDDQEGKPAETMIKDRQSTVRTIYKSEDNLNNIRGTRWGALNAVTQYVDHEVPRKGDEAKLKAQWGITPTPLKDKAVELLTA